jgi:transcriptional regulator with XRE-family HTH domain
MQKRKTVSKLLGLKQEELAMLLKVNKSQLGMFETGKRELPTAALLLLAPMLQFLKEERLKSGSAEILKSQEEQKKKVWEHLLKENKYFQTEVSKKLEMAERKYQANMSAIQLMQYLQNEATKKGETPDDLLELIEARAVSDLRKNNWGVVTKHQLEYEFLQAEEIMLLKMLG